MHGRSDPVGIEIGSGENAAHPGHRASDCGIDAFYERMPVWRAQHDAVQLVGKIDVIDIAPVPNQKPPVFEPVQRTPDITLCHPPVPAVDRDSRVFSATFGAAVGEVQDRVCPYSGNSLARPDRLDMAPRVGVLSFPLTWLEGQRQFGDAAGDVESPVTFDAERLQRD